MAATKLWLYQILLALQCGAQPLITKRFIGKDVIVTSNILTCEIAKIVFASLVLANQGILIPLFKQWTLVGALIASGLPAVIFALQSSLTQIAYRNLDSLTFTILNQTKLIFTALFMYIIMGHKQSTKQIGALTLLVCAASLLSIGESSGSHSGAGSDESSKIMVYGIIPILVASVLSGLASSLCQWASQVKKRTPYLVTIEMSCTGSIFMLLSMIKSPDGEAISKYGFFHGWSGLTLIPICVNAIGGILVGLVTTYAGGVKKGFVLVSALLLTALLQYVFDGKPPSHYCLIALPLVVCSTIIYQRNPHKVKEKKF